MLIAILSCFYVQAQKPTTLTVNLNFPKNDSSVVTLSLFNANDSSLIATKAATTKTVNFTVTQFTKYIIKASGITVETLEKTIGITDKLATVFIDLKRKTKSLKEVTVTARKPLIRQEDDKTIVDAEVLANSGTNAYEVLEKTPSAVVDQDGNVYLNSMTPATIQINGREVKLGSADLASLLKSLPAGSVSKIEILRNPSAKYDAASSGGIINIVLKKGVKLGSSGSVHTGYFQGVYHTKFIGYNLNKSSNKISSYFSQQIMHRNNFEELNSKRIISLDNSTLSQNAYTRYPTINFYNGAGIDYTINKKLNIGTDIRLGINKNKSDAENKSLVTNNNSQNLLSNNLSLINNNSTSWNIDNNMYAKYKIDSTGSEWNSQIGYTHFNNINNQDYNNVYYLPIAPTLVGDGKTKAIKNILLIQSDLTLKLKKKLTLETGIKATISKSNNAADYFKQTGSGNRKIDSFQTNTFRYTENIASAYFQVAKTFAGFTLKPGLRMEITDISGKQVVPKDTSLSIRRTDFFPYVFLRHRIAKLFGFELMGNLIYRRSISRPYYETLNPYPKYVDQYLFETGNPNLKPQFTTNYEFNIMADDFPIVSAGINQTKDIFSNVTYQDDVTKIAYRTYDNLGKNKEYYLRFVGGIPPGGKFTFYAGAQHNYNEYEGVYQNKPLAYKRGSWTFFTYQEFKPTKTLRISMHGFMRTKGLQNFYELKNFGALNMSINKSILKKKGNLILAFNDIFRTNKIEFALKQGTVNAFGSRINDTRRAGLTFRYSFGIKPKEEKKNAFEQPSESSN